VGCLLVLAQRTKVAEKGFEGRLHHIQAVMVLKSLQQEPIAVKR
jgi:hypothetical protein